LYHVSCTLVRSSHSIHCSFLPPAPPSSTLFPYTTLFRSYSFRNPWNVGTAQRNAKGNPSGRLPQHSPEPERRHRCGRGPAHGRRSEEHTSELQSRFDLVCRLLLEKKKNESREHGWGDKRR